MRILLVEDEPSLLETLEDRLTSEGYQVETARTGRDAYRLACGQGYDLIILDVMLPGKSGMDICRDLRQKGRDMPILMLTAKRQVIDKVLGLKLGADDYLTKPFDMMELMARVEALLRRARKPIADSANTYRFGSVVVDFRAARVTCEEETLHLSALDFKLLKYFIDHRGKTLSREELLENVWGYDSAAYTRTVDVRIASLRQKIERNPNRPEFIHTVHGMGYRFTG